MEKQKQRMPFNWHQIDWKFSIETVERTQDAIVKAVMCGKWNQVFNLQRQLVVMFETRALAVRHIVSNQEVKISGVDHKIWNNPNDYYNAIQELGDITKNPNTYKASPVKLVYIPKLGTSELIPIGVPTLIDRALQKVYHLAIDPVVECFSDNNSYGYRKYRSTQDAITTLRSLLDKPTSPNMILETDIAKGLDRIDHDFIINHTPICDKHILREWLKSGISIQRNFKEIGEGTPKGGVISQLLCNIILNGIEELINNRLKSRKHDKTLGSRPKVHVIRYANEIVITGVNKKLLEEAKGLLMNFLSERGLELKNTKTRIVSVTDGFDFLGYNIKRVKLDKTKNKNNDKQDSVLIIQPNKDNITKIKSKIKKTIDFRKPIETIIRDANPLLRGWSEYYRISYHSQSIFIKLGDYIWKLMWKWARKRHPKRNAKYLFEKYTRTIDKNKWSWVGSLNKPLFAIQQVKMIILRPLKQNMNPYIIENKKYYEMKKTTKLLTKFRAAIYKKYEHKCAVCGDNLHNEEQIELHHINPAATGGKYTMENIVPLHKICHQQITQSPSNKHEADLKYQDK